MCGQIQQVGTIRSHGRSLRQREADRIVIRDILQDMKRDLPATFGTGRGQTPSRT
jgi:hypothetical protein